MGANCTNISYCNGNNKESEYNMKLLEYFPKEMATVLRE